MESDRVDGIGSVSVWSPPEWGGFSLEPCSLCPGAGYTAPCVFLLGHLIRRGLSCLPRVPNIWLQSVTLPGKGLPSLLSVPSDPKIFGLC